jgi:hypothetical protein
MANQLVGCCVSQVCSLTIGVCDGNRTDNDPEAIMLASLSDLLAGLSDGYAVAAAHGYDPPG